MQKKLTITVNERLYERPHKVIGRGNISGFIESLLRPYLLSENLEDAYRRMAEDETRESEALEWSEGTTGDIADEPR